MWISVKEVALLLGITERAVELNCKEGNYSCRCIKGKGRGGKQYEIELDSLPESAKLKYYGANVTSDVISSERPVGCSLKQWQEAERKANIVKEYRNKGLSVNDFLAWYNETYAPKKLLTRDTLFTYQRKYFDGGIYALIDTRGGITGGIPITEEIWDYFCSLYLTQQRRTVKLCYDKTKEKYGEPFPSVSSFERNVNSSLDKATILYYRYGPQALKDNLPSMKRDRTTINSNDIWFSDHRNVDLFVRNEKGKIYRPYVTVFFDARSNKVISFIAREDNPNSIVIKQCLKLGIIKHGVPKEVYFDNGKDYRSKYFNKDYPYSLVQKIGINCIYATPYHGQAKTVERFFGTMSERFDKLFPTYCGKDNKNRPEQMRISNKKIAKLAPSTKEYLEALEAWIENYNNTLSTAEFMNNESPNVVYNKNLKYKVKVNQEALEMLFATVNTRKVHKNGITIYNNNFYNSKLIPYFGKEVIVRNYPENIDKVYIFDTEENFICEAAAKRVSAYRNTSEQDFKNAQKEKKAVYNHVKQFEPKRNIPLYELIVKKQAEEYTANATNEIDYVNSKAQAAATAVKEAESKKNIDRAKISRIMNEYYDKMKQA